MNVTNNFGRQERSNKPILVKPTVIGKSLMGPPININKKFVTPLRTNSRTSAKCLSSRSKSSSAKDQLNTIVALSEGRGAAQGIVGLAAIDIYQPTLVLCELTDTQMYTSTLTKINILQPAELLVPSTFLEGAVVSRLCNILSDHFPTVTVSSLPRSEFNRERGQQFVRSLCATSYRAIVCVAQRKVYAMAAACALLRYVETVRHVSFASQTIRVVYQSSEKTTAIDIDTANRLNLVTTPSEAHSTNAKHPPSLLAIVDHCVTNVGRRLLRNDILQPPCCFRDIEERHDCVQELLEQPQHLQRLREVLSPLANIESALTFATLLPATAATCSERQLTYSLQLKGLLLALEPLTLELRAMRHPVFRAVYNRLSSSDTFSKILQHIAAVINDEAHLARGQAGELQRCFAIKPGINGFLDLARRLYTEVVDNMRSYVQELAQQYNLPLRVQYSFKRGYHIILPLTKATRNMQMSDLPALFEKVNRFGSHMAMTTIEMINLGKRIQRNSVEIQSLSNIIIYKLLITVRPQIGDLYELCDDVALLDLLMSIAQCSTNAGFVKPHFSTSYTHVEGLRHPILEYTCDSELITNSVCMVKRSNIHIITGPNMSGKSVFVRSVCLAQILAQLGCRVPAEKATFRVCDRLYAQLTNESILECGGLSSFALEMSRVAFLLNTLTDSSLVVLDELCRTTNCDDGMSLSFAICEKLATRGAFAFIVTHYLSLTVLADMYSNISNWHMETIEQLHSNKNRSTLKFTYKLQENVTKIESYGIKLSRIANCSKSVSDRAEELVSYMRPMIKNLSTDKALNVNYLRGKLMAEIDVLRVKGQLTPELEKKKHDDFKSKTNFTYTPNESLHRVTSTETNSTSTEHRKVSTSSDTINNCADKSKASSNARSIFSISKSSGHEQKSECDIFSDEGAASDVEILSYNSFRFNDFSTTLTVGQSQSFCDPLHIILKRQINQNNTSSKRKSSAEPKDQHEPLVSDLYWSDSSSEYTSATSQENVMNIALIEEDEFFSHLSNKQGILTSTPKRNISLEPPNTQCEDLDVRRDAYGSVEDSVDSESLSKKVRNDVGHSLRNLEKCVDDSQTFKSIAENSIFSEYRRTNHESTNEFFRLSFGSRNLLSDDISYVTCDNGPLINESQLNFASSITKLLPDTPDSKPSPAFVKKPTWRPPFKKEQNN